MLLFLATHEVLRSEITDAPNFKLWAAHKLVLGDKHALLTKGVEHQSSRSIWKRYPACLFLGLAVELILNPIGHLGFELMDPSVALQHAWSLTGIQWITRLLQPKLQLFAGVEAWKIIRIWQNTALTDDLVGVLVLLLYHTVLDNVVQLPNHQIVALSYRFLGVLKYLGLFSL